MFKVSREFIHKWIDADEGRFPAFVDTICPYCGLPVAFGPLTWKQAPEVDAYVATARCAGCGRRPSFYWVADNAAGDSPAAGEGGEEPHFDLFIHPTPRNARRPVEGLNDSREFDVALQRAYASAVNMYNAREWTGTVVICRRTLEDIAKALLPEDLQKLHLSKQIEALRKSKDLSEPVAALAHGLRRSGQLNPYFDLEKAPTREVATMVLDLLEYLITYLFALPGRIQMLDRSIEHLHEGGAD